jgi:dolichol-phosphate mannosyltransferase
MKFNLLHNFIKNPQIYKFLAVAIGSASTGLFLIMVLTSFLEIFYVISVLIVLELFVFINFIIHERWTFSDIPKSTKKINRFIKFNAVALIAILINESILIFLTELVGINYIISEVGAMGLTFFFNFTVGRKMIWNK